MRIAEEGSESRYISREEFLRLIDDSVCLMSRLMMSPPPADALKKGLFSFSYMERFLNNLIVKDMLDAMNRAGVSLEELFMTSPAEVDLMIDNITHAYNETRTFLHFAARVAFRRQRRRYSVLSDTDSLKALKTRIMGFIEEYKNDMHDYFIRYGRNLFSDHAVARAGANVMAMRLFADSDNRPCPPKKAMYAIALLHPLTDDLFDRGIIENETIHGISAALAGDVPEARNPAERCIFSLIADIFSDYQPKEHPLLSLILSTLHFEQSKSKRQHEHDCPIEEIITISLRKGGLSTLAAGYIATGGLDAATTRFFFENGAIFQFVDDLSDIEEDIKDGNRTVWTVAVESGALLDEVLKRVAALQAWLVPRNENHAAATARPVFAVNIERFGFALLVLKGYFMHEARFSLRLRRYLATLSPVDFPKLRKTILLLQPKFDMEVFRIPC